MCVFVGVGVGVWCDFCLFLRLINWIHAGGGVPLAPTGAPSTCGRPQWLSVSNVAPQVTAKWPLRSPNRGLNGMHPFLGLCSSH